jgi:hypothetical protein
LKFSNQIFFFTRILSDGMSGELEDGRLWKGYQILGTDEKPNWDIKMLFIRH